MKLRIRKDLTVCHCESRSDQGPAPAAGGGMSPVPLPLPFHSLTKLILFTSNPRLVINNKFKKPLSFNQIIYFYYKFNVSFVPIKLIYLNLN